MLNIRGEKSIPKKEGKWIEVDGIRYLDFTPDIRPLQAMLSMTHLDICEIDSRLQKERHMNRLKAANDFKA